MSWMQMAGRCGRGTLLAPCLVALIGALSGVSIAQQAPALADFEDGLGAWRTECGALAGDEDLGDVVSVYVSSKTHDGGGRGCLFATFRAAARATARIALDIDGAALHEAGAQALSFWVRPYGAGSSVQMVFSGTDEGGAAHEYIATLHLAESDWTLVRVPLGKFTENGLPMGDALRYMDTFAFRKAGSWDHFYFRIDDLSIGSGTGIVPPEVTGPAVEPDEPADEGDEQPGAEPDAVIAPEDVPPPDRPLGPLSPIEPVVGPTGPPGTEVLPPPGPEFAHALTVDFSQPMVPYRPALGGSVLPKDAPLLENQAVAERLRALNLTILRVRVAVPASMELADDALALLDRAIAARESIGARSAMICLDVSFDASLDAAKLGALAASLARRYNIEKQTPVTYWEVFNAPAFLGKPDHVRASEIAEQVAKALRTVDPAVRPGGLGFATPARDKLGTLMGSAPGLVFYSWHFYGSHFVDTPPDGLLTAARSGIAYDAVEPFGPADVERLLVETFGQVDKLLFVTECNSNSVRAGEAARDPKLRTPLNSAWVASALISFAPYVDVVFLSRLVGDGWGILEEDGTPDPAYWAALLASRYARRGSQMCLTDTSEAPVRALATRGEGTRHVLLVNQRNAPADVTLRAVGLAGRCSVQGWLVQRTAGNELPTYHLRATFEASATTGGAADTRPGFTATVPNIVLPPYGVVAIEFDESKPLQDAPTEERAE